MRFGRKRLTSRSAKKRVLGMRAKLFRGKNRRSRSRFARRLSASKRRFRR